MSEITHNRRPDFGVWIEIAYHVYHRAGVVGIYEKYLMQENYLMYADDLFKVDLNIAYTTLAASLKSKLCSPEHMQEGYVWDEDDVDKLLILRNEWCERWYTGMACPYKADVRCKGIGCMAWDVSTECCMRLEADTLALNN